MPGRFVVRLTPSFRRDLEELPAAAQEKVLDALKRLEANPFGPPPKT
jgi:mRNA-degrading endonuclease RelE of RelBE toxin-antitoxin system